jgi:hypothetical protein
MQEVAKKVFHVFSILLVGVISYYVHISIQIYSITQSIKPAHVTDLPQFEKICWVPVISAFAFRAFKSSVMNYTRPIFLCICKDQHD